MKLLRLAAGVLVCAFAFAGPLVADVYVANTACASVTVYGAGATGNAAPVRTISGPATGFNFPEGVTADTVNNELYVADFFGGTIRVFALNASGNVAPVRTLSGSNTGIVQPRMVAVDAVHNEIFVASSPDDGIRVFTRLASGNVAPIRTITGVATKINNPISIAFNPVADELFVDSYDVGGSQVPGILVFNRLDNGNQAPKRSITGSNTLFGTFTNFVTLDIANGELFAQGDDGTGIVVFNLADNGNVAPKRNLTGAATGFFDIGGIRVDNANSRVIATNQAQGFSSNEILVYSRTATGNTKPLLSIAGPATGLCNPFGLDLDTAGGFTGTITDTTVPTALAKSVSTTINIPVNVTLTATDPDNTSFLFTITVSPTHGSADNFNGSTGTFIYTPDNDYVGPDSLSFVASDGVNVSAPAVVSISVINVPTGIPTLGFPGLAALALALAAAGFLALKK